MKLPAFQFYPGDWRKDPGVQSLSYHDRGVWFEMLLLMHESPVRGKLMLGKNAISHEVLAAILHIDVETLTSTVSTLLQRGVTEVDEGTGALINRRMLRDEEDRSNGRNRLTRWRSLRNLQKTNNNGNANETLQRNANETQMKRLSSSSSSSSNKRKNIKKEITEIGDAKTIYDAYPRHVGGRDHALKAIEKAIKKISPDRDANWLLERVRKFSVLRKGEDPQYTPYPATWFNKGSYDDENLQTKPPTVWVDSETGEPINQEKTVNFEDPVWS